MVQTNLTIITYHVVKVLTFSSALIIAEVLSHKFLYNFVSICSLPRESVKNV